MRNTGVPTQRTLSSLEDEVEIGRKAETNIDPHQTCEASNVKCNGKHICLRVADKGRIGSSFISAYDDESFDCVLGNVVTTTEIHWLLIATDSLVPFGIAHGPPWSSQMLSQAMYAAQSAQVNIYISWMVSSLCKDAAGPTGLHIDRVKTSFLGLLFDEEQSMLVSWKKFVLRREDVSGSQWQSGEVNVHTSNSILKSETATLQHQLFWGYLCN